MSLEKMKRIIEKEFGVNSISNPLGSCTEKFLNNKILDVEPKNNFPVDIIDLFQKNPYKFGTYQKFDNGNFSGKYFISLFNT